MKWKIPVECTEKYTDSATMESAFAMLFPYWEPLTQQSTEKTSAVIHSNLYIICAFSICFPNQFKLSILQTFKHIKLSKLPIIST